MVTDEVCRGSGALAVRGSAERPDLDLVLCVPYVQQEDIVHQHGVRRNHATWQQGPENALVEQARTGDFTSRYMWRSAAPVPMLPYAR